MLKRWVMVLGAGAGLMLPAGVHAAPITRCSAVGPCVSYDLSTAGSTYTLFVKYVSAGVTPSGRLTAAGIYDVKNGTDFTFSDLIVSGPDAGWSTDCTGLAGAGIGQPLFEACAQEVNPGVLVGQQVAISFKLGAGQAFTLADLASGSAVGALAHIQGVGPTTCSVKIVSNSAVQPAFDRTPLSECSAPTTTTTPEPVSMALLGTGLVGLVAARRRKRYGSMDTE